MKQIKLSNTHYIVVDDSEIKEGDWCLDFDNKRIYQSKTDEHKGIFQKITHSTQPLGIGWQQEVIELSLQEVKELIGEMDVEKKAQEYAIKSSSSSRESRRKGYLDGYNQCLEDYKDKKYTEEDLRKAWKIGYRGESIEEYVQSLQSPTEWEVEIVEGKLKRK